MARHLLTVVMAVALLITVSSASVAATTSGQSDLELSVPSRVYEVNQRVSEFPEEVDLSAPETTCAALYRLRATGRQEEWAPLSVRELRAGMSGLSDQEVPAEEAQRHLNARIAEVRIYEGRYAVVVVVEEGSRYPVKARILGLEEGRWLNRGENAHQSLEEARQSSDQFRWRYLEPPSLSAPADPEAFLAPFVDFLRIHGEDPHSFAMRVLSEHSLVIMGEVHHRPLHWQFNSSLVRDPEFPQHVGVIYLELPPNDQALVDQFLAGESCDPQLVVQMLRDMLAWGWPDQAMLDFFETVWMVNQTLAPEQRLRIVLVDMPRPWSEIENVDDWSQYELVPRDQQMADNILADLRAHPRDTRHGLFIVGVGHAHLNFTSVNGRPATSAGWHLRKALGPDNVYVLFPHQAVMTNVGQVSGRLMWGLFDSAFAVLGNNPVAFPLTSGPFGEQRFDGMPDSVLAGTYRDGYSAYLYLGPLEYETFSPLVASFYTDEFLRELDRRSRVMSGRGLVEDRVISTLDREEFVALMERDWGRPRANWQADVLGLIDAWRLGSEWQEVEQEQKLAAAMEHPEEIRQAAQELFAEIQQADYQQFLSGELSWMDFPIVGFYTTQQWFDYLVNWICEKFSANPITSVELGEVFRNDEGLPTVPYELTLEDGETLRGELPFTWEFDGGAHWQGREGLDWHLQSEEQPE